MTSCTGSANSNTCMSCQGLTAMDSAFAQYIAMAIYIYILHRWLLVHKNSLHVVVATPSKWFKVHIAIQIGKKADIQSELLVFRSQSGVFLRHNHGQPPKTKLATSLVARNVVDLEYSIPVYSSTKCTGIQYVHVCSYSSMAAFTRGTGSLITV